MDNIDVAGKLFGDEMEEQPKITPCPEHDCRSEAGNCLGKKCKCWGGKYNETNTTTNQTASSSSSPIFNNQSEITLNQIEEYFKQHNIKSMIWENNQLLVQAETNPSDQTMEYLANFCQANKLQNFTSENLAEFKKNYTEKPQSSTNYKKILP